MHSPKVLFILKHRDNYNEFTSGYGTGKSSGLSNSARFVCEMLVAAGVEAKLVEVTDNNCIDKEVHAYRPTHVIIEALWVVPEKFEILHKLHPSVQWIIRGHSEIPFLSNEGIAIEWIKRYVTLPNVVFASNSIDSVRDLRTVVKSIRSFWSDSFVEKKVIYLPNYYPIKPRSNTAFKSDELNVACLGAIRPLKNQLIQAIAAVQFADNNKLRLRFHVNASRKEQGGGNNHKNIVALFQGTRHTLVEHEWMEHEDLLDFLRGMDLSLNVSLSESFNIVAADSVSQNVPVVCSPEVFWTSPFSQADPTSTTDIVRKIGTVLSWHKGGLIRRHNLRRLSEYSRKSRNIWLHWVFLG